jgi:hypothetical protein
MSGSLKLATESTVAIRELSYKISHFVERHAQEVRRVSQVRR